MTTWVIARLTFLEAARRKILLAALVLGLVFLVVYGLGFYYIQQEFERNPNGPPMLARREILSFLMLAGLYVVNFLTVMMAVLTSVDTISGEIASGTIHTLVTKPVRRWEVVLGKWLGFVGMLTLYLLLMAGGVMALVYAVSGYTAPNALRGLGLMWINALLLLNISLLGGTTLSTLANGVLVFGLYGVAFVGGWIEQIGAFPFIQNQTAVNIGIISSLIIPSEALWKRAVFEMQSPLAGIIGTTPFTASSVPSPLMIEYAALYAAVVLALAIRQFKKRDL
jgi:Cu-processing system permease protein